MTKTRTRRKAPAAGGAGRAGAAAENGAGEAASAPVARVARLAELLPDRRNANQGTERGREMLEGSMRKYGAGRSILVDKHGRIIGGNKTHAVALGIGLQDAIVIPTDGRRLVVVQRTDLDLETDPEAMELGVADNRTGEVSLTWDAAILQELQAAGASFDGLWSQDELLGLLHPGAKDGKTDPDDVPEVRATDIQAGDLFELGNHRLLCGDATNADDVVRVTSVGGMAATVTSPPYAAQRKYGLGDFDWDAVVPPAIWLASRATADDGHVLVNLGLIHHDGCVVEYWRTLLDAMSESRPLHGWYVWDKMNGMPGDHRGRLAMSHEWIFHFAKSPRAAAKTAECKMAGLMTHRPGKRSGLRGSDDIVSHWTHEGRVTQPFKVADSVFRLHPAKGGVDGHPAPFPVEFAAAMMEPFVRSGESVFEPFSGSGTTVIACEQLNIRSCAMEIEPRYVQVSIDRWEAFTGQKAVKVGEAIRA